MKFVKITYLSSCILGAILFIIGITLLVNIKYSPSQVKIDDTKPSSDSNSFNLIDNYTTNKNPTNFLVLIKEASGDNTDTLVIANYSPETRQINLLTIPRDTKASMTDDLKINSIFDVGLRHLKRPKGTSDLEHKQNALEYTVQTISNLTNIKIDYYIYLEIDTVKAIVDKLDGIYFDVPAKLKYIDPTQDLHIDLKKGYQLLDGDKAEQLLRFRKAQRRYYTPEELKEVEKFYNGSDLKRTEMQIKFVNAIIEQKVNLLELPRLIPIISYAFENVITNTDLNDILSLFRAFTQGSRPEMNTFKLYGIDKRINGADFVIYNKTIEDTKSRDIQKADDIIDKYFTISSGNFTPDPDKFYDFNASTWDNPSNTESDSTGDNKDKP